LLAARESVGEHPEARALALVSAAWPEKVCGLLATCAGSHGGHDGAL
jgi:hypothetical protein